MAARGRKSAEALAVVAGTIDRRPDPPKNLTEFQKEIWRRTVASEPHDFFTTAATQHLLILYCRHCESEEFLSQAIIDFEQMADFMTAKQIEMYDELLKMRDRETKAIESKATKLRLTNQARYVPRQAATASKQVTEMKPWAVAS